MPNLKWLIPDKKGRSDLVTVTWQIPLAFSRALKEYQSRLNKRTKKKVSMAAILTTLSRRASPKLNELTEKYERGEADSSPPKR